MTIGVPKVLAESYVPVKQDDAKATLAPILKKEDGVIDFTKTAKAVHDHVRGMIPWPGASTKTKGKVVKVHSTRIATELAAGASKAAPGTVIFADKTRVLVACGEGVVELVRVQLEGKKPVTGAEWHLGRGVAAGDVLG